ncbi:hypothetical protein ANN_10032 [Periplaneta americana]|uniref:Uncharacterized protein n=1 Tax=Periplaneta americana TaxID=6978 RepID=A0ABQ8TQL9_PERAM|nr:hypothetical protein ANN_10032 [Periplaneta americana]
MPDSGVVSMKSSNQKGSCFFLTSYGHEIWTWLANHRDSIKTYYKVSELFGGAHARAATVETAISGFQKLAFTHLIKTIHDFDISNEAKGSKMPDHIII